MPRMLAVGMLVGGVGLLVSGAPVAADDGGRPITVPMTGEEEAPNAGDLDGSGTASFRFNIGQGEVCYTLTVQDILPATAAHIHLAPAGVAGPVVIPLQAPTSGTSSACASADRDLLKDIIQNPDAYYVNVHNAEFPGGAVRGQLSK